MLQQLATINPTLPNEEDSNQEAIKKPTEKNIIIRLYLWNRKICNYKIYVAATSSFVMIVTNLFNSLVFIVDNA